MSKVVLIVLEPFRDKTDTKKVFSRGDTLETADINRVNDLVKRGFAKITAIVDEEHGNDTNANANDSDAGAKATQKPGTVSFRDSEYDVQTVKDALIAINVPVAPNAGVKGLTAKIADLNDEQAQALADKLAEKN